MLHETSFQIINTYSISETIFKVINTCYSRCCVNQMWILKKCSTYIIVHTIKVNLFIQYHILFCLRFTVILPPSPT